MEAGWIFSFIVVGGVLQTFRAAMNGQVNKLVPETWNVLVNPRHPKASLLEITMTYEHAFDFQFF